MANELFSKGSQYQVEFLRLPDGTLPAKAFLESFTPADARRHKDRRRIVASIDYLSNNKEGRRLGREHFKRVEGSDGIFEFKAHQLRLFSCFASGGRIVLLDGVIKQQDDLRPEDVARAERYRRDYVK